MTALFEGAEVKVVSMQNQIKQAKELFKVKCRRVVNEVHQEDWDELEACLVKSLEAHFAYWDKIMKEIQKSAIEAFEQMDKEHVGHKADYHEYLQNVLRLVPRDNGDILNFKKMEEMLVNLFE